MLYTQEAVWANIRNLDGRRVFYLGRGDTLTSGARDWLQQQRIDILSAENAKPERFLLLSGGYSEEKPEHMTHLNARVLVPKTHPRIAFRGAMDTLEAELILAQLAVDSGTAADLEEILELARLVIRCDVLEEPLNRDTLCGLSWEEQRRRSHRPQDYYGTAHFMPAAADGLAMARLNRARCAAREAERTAAEAFSDREGLPLRPDLVLALNRMSSMLYILMVKNKR